MIIIMPVIPGGAGVTGVLRPGCCLSHESASESLAAGAAARVGGI